MHVTPISAEKANEQNGSGEPFKAGDYDFIVQDAEETTSKAGNDMLKLTLHVFNREGNKRTVFDYILATEAAAWKARHMMESIGMVRSYEKGIIEPREIIGRPGLCKLRIKPAQGEYPAQNAVADYLPAVNGMQRARAPDSRPEPPPIDDDNIPF